jgi:hypothetical protein
MPASAAVPLHVGRLATLTRGVDADVVVVARAASNAARARVVGRHVVVT